MRSVEGNSDAALEAPHALRGDFSQRHLAVARKRLGRLPLVLATLVAIDSPFFAWSEHAFQNPVMMAELAILTFYPLALDFALFLTARNDRLSDEAVVRFGLLYHPLRCLPLALFPVRLEGLLGLTPTPVTFVCAAVAAFPILVPAPPKKLLLATVLAACTQPLALLATVAPISGAVVVGSVLSAAVSVAVGILCGRMSYGLSVAASEHSEVGAYRLVRKIGQGAAGEVWLARHRLLARPAAIKTVRSEEITRGSHTDALHRLEREAQLVARLTSLHTVTVYDYGFSREGFFYCVMELLEGANLRTFVEQNGPLAPREAVQVALEVCESLAEAHRLGLVHRDLKPENLFRARIGLREDFTKVLDFGLAGFKTGRGEKARSLEWATLRASGTPGYLPPELVTGGQIDHRADLYQLGCVMYFLLTGETLFARASVEEATRAHLDETPPPLAEMGARAVPPALEGVILRCLAKRPEDRFDSAVDLEDALGAIADDLDSKTPFELHHVRLSKLAEELPPWRVDETAPLRGAHRELLVGPARVADTHDSKRRHAASALTAEIAGIARSRLAQLACLAMVLTIVCTPPWLLSRYPSLTWLPVTLGSLLGLVLDAVLVRTVKARNVSDNAAFYGAISYFLVRGAILSFLPMQVAALLGTEPPRMTLTLLLAIILPVFVPFGPAKLVVPLALLASMQQIALFALTSAEARAPMLADSMANVVIALFGSLFLCSVTTAQRRGALSDATFGAYTLERLIGRGGMGEVWLAEHEYLARPAAIKLVRSDNGNGAREALVNQLRFEREAQITATLTSTHTVTLYDYGVSPDGARYYVMELLQGTDLSRLVRSRGPCPPAEAIRIGLSICDSLAEAHARGLVHRDLKPSNVFSCSVGRRTDFIKVLDFGLARPDTVRSTSLSAGDLRLLGTPAYMAPEVFLGQPATVASDVYALGCVLYFLMTGQAPFERDSLGSMAVAHLKQPPPRVSEGSPLPVPEALEGVVARCLAKDAKDRFTSAADLALSLERVRRRHGYEGPRFDEADAQLIP